MDPSRRGSGLKPITEEEPRAVSGRDIELELGIQEEFEEVQKSPVNSFANGGNIVDCGEPLDALDTNVEQTHVAAGGSRGVFKLYKIYDDYLELSADMRAISQRKLNLFYSPSNVAWSQIDSNMIATTSTNGAVVLWDVGRAKLDRTYKVHTRSAICLAFHPSSAHVLISGARDSTIIMYDIREAEPTMKFCINGFDAVRDVKFGVNADQAHLFASCDDSGTIQLWDMRRNDLPFYTFHGHNGYVSSIAFGPDSRYMMATGGGRDKMIKVWDWQNASMEGPTYTLEAMAPIARVYWRPGGSTQLSSCSTVNDPAVHIWDIRRPFLPYATFGEHSDSTTDMVFLINNPDRMISSGKDGMLILHDFHEATYPINYANDVAIDTAPDGLLAVAVNSQIPDKRPYIDQQNTNSEFFFPLHPTPPPLRRPADPYRGPTGSVLRCGQPALAAPVLTDRLFSELAREYRVGGAPPPQLAGYNSDVAERHGLREVSLSFRMIAKLMLADAEAHGYPAEWRDEGCERHHGRISARQRQLHDEGSFMMRTVYGRNGGGGTRCTIDDEDIVPDFIIEMYDDGFRQDNLEMMITKSTAEDMEMKEARWKLQKKRARSPLHEPNSSSEDDDYNTKKLARWREPKSIPPIKQTREDEVVHVVKRPEVIKDALQDYALFGEYHQGDDHTDVRRKDEEDGAWTGRARSGYAWRPLPNEKPWKADRKWKEYWKWLSAGGIRGNQETGNKSIAVSVEEIMKRHADENDIQTCAVIALMFGNTLARLVGLQLVNSWISAYFAMLSRLRLYVAMAEIRKYCKVEIIAENASAGLHVIVGCKRCKGVIEGEDCTKCGYSVRSSLCSVCRRALLTLTWACENCNHGYHPSHARSWFRMQEMCAVIGCDCLCAFYENKDSRAPLVINPRNVPRRKPTDPQPEFTAIDLMWGHGWNTKTKWEVQRDQKRKQLEELNRGTTHAKVAQAYKERWKLRQKLKRRGIPIDSETVIPAMRESSEEEIIMFKEDGTREKVRRKKKWAMERDRAREQQRKEERRRLNRGRRELLGEKCSSTEEEETASDEEEDASTGEDQGWEGGEEEEEEDSQLGLSEDEEEEEYGGRRGRKGGRRRAGVSRTKHREEVPLNCRCGACDDCELFEGWKDKERATVEERKKEYAAALEAYHEMIGKDWSVNKPVGSYPKYKYPQHRRPRHKAPPPGVSAEIKGPLKLPRVVRPIRQNYKPFTLGKMARIFEWQSIEWQRKLKCRRIAPRAFFEHAIFHYSEEEWRNLPLERIEGIIDDCDAVLRHIYAQRKKQPRPYERKGAGSAYLRRGRSAAGSLYPPAAWLRRPKRTGRHGRKRLTLKQALLMPTRKPSGWNPPKADRYTRTADRARWEEKPEEQFWSAYDKKLHGWSRMTPEKRLDILIKHRRAAKMARDQKNVFERQYKLFDWVYKEQQKKRCPLTWLDGYPGKRAKERQEAENKRRLEEACDEASVTKDLEALRLENRDLVQNYLPHWMQLSEEEMLKKKEQRGQSRYFNIDEMFDEKDMKMIAKMQMRLDVWRRIEHDNREVDEQRKREEQREERKYEHEIKVSKFWRKVHAERSKDPDYKVPPMPQDSLSREQERQAEEKRYHDRVARFRHLVHRKMIAKAMEPYLDTHMVTTRDWSRKRQQKKARKK